MIGTYLVLLRVEIAAFHVIAKFSFCDYSSLWLLANNFSVSGHSDSETINFNLPRKLKFERALSEDPRLSTGGG